ncbi:MAG: TetR/AcrR family transcriptional regulator [Halobacteriaceae archaeon]
MSGSADSEERDTREQIMAATYHALRKHGYANLTMQNIADEFEKSKSLLHYHFDTKDDLMLAFLEYAVGWMADRVEEETPEDPETRLRRYVERLSLGPEDDGAWVLTLFELRLQAAHNEAFQERLADYYETNCAALADIIADGVEDGVFHEEDPRGAAEAIYAALEGARMAHVTLGLAEISERTAAAVADRFLGQLKTPPDRNA